MPLIKESVLSLKVETTHHCFFSSIKIAHKYYLEISFTTNPLNIIFDDFGR